MAVTETPPERVKAAAAGAALLLLPALVRFLLLLEVGAPCREVDWSYGLEKM